MCSPHELNYLTKIKLSAELKDAARRRLYRQVILQLKNSNWIENLAGGLSQIGENTIAVAEEARNIKPQAA